MRFQLNFKSGKAVYQQLVDQVKVAAAAGAVQPGDPLPGDPAARRGAPRQPQHRRQGLHRARKPGRHRDRRRQGVFRPRPGQLPFPEGRPAEAPRRIARRRRSCTRIICKSAGRNSCNSRRTDSTRSSSSGLAPRRHDAHDSANTPVIEIRDLVRRYGRTDAVDGLNLQRAAGPMLRVLRP